MKKHATMKNWNTAINIGAMTGGGLGMMYGIAVHADNAYPATEECVTTPLTCGVYGSAIGICVALLPVVAPVAGLSYGIQKLVHSKTSSDD